MNRSPCPTLVDVDADHPGALPRNIPSLQSGQRAFRGRMILPDYNVSAESYYTEAACSMLQSSRTFGVQSCFPSLRPEQRSEGRIRENTRLDYFRKYVANHVWVRRRINQSGIQHQHARVSPRSSSNRRQKPSCLVARPQTPLSPSKHNTAP
jgi:hypothetical protein